MVHSNDVNVENLLRGVWGSSLLHSNLKTNTHSHCSKHTVESGIFMTLNRFIYIFKIHGY